MRYDKTFKSVHVKWHPHYALNRYAFFLALDKRNEWRKNRLRLFNVKKCAFQYWNRYSVLILSIEKKNAHIYRLCLAKVFYFGEQVHKIKRNGLFNNSSLEREHCFWAKIVTFENLLIHNCDPSGARRVFNGKIGCFQSATINCRKRQKLFRKLFETAWGSEALGEAYPLFDCRRLW